MAKNWYDGPVPTADLGILGGLPSLALTEEDKKRAFWQAMMQGGMGMAAASLGGANTAQSLGKGLLGGADAYGQGLMAPQSRFDAYAKQLKVQGDQIGNAKGLEELGKLKREASDYGKQNEFFSMLNDPGQAAMLYGGGPTLQNEQRATQFGANPAAMLSDPRINLKALQARVDPKQLGAALENTRPYEQKPGMFYNGQYMPDPTKGIAFNNGIVAPLKGAQETQNALAYGTKAGELAAQLNYDRAKLPYDVQRAGQVAGAEAGARDPFNFQTVQGPNGQPVFMTNPQARGMAQNQFPGTRIDPQVQAQRDAVAQGIYDAEGAGKYSPRLNDRLGAGVAPQVMGIEGASPVSQKAKDTLNTNWVEKTYQPILDAGAAAQSTLDNIQGLRGTNISTGLGTELKANLARLGAVFGIPGAEKYAGDVQRFKALAVENVNKELNLAKGPQTDQDAKRAQSIFVQLGNTPAANEFLLDYATAAQNYKKRAAAFHQEAVGIAQKTGDLTEVSRRWRNVAGSIWDDPVMQKWNRK